MAKPAHARYAFPNPQPLCRRARLRQLQEAAQTPRAGGPGGHRHLRPARPARHRRWREAPPEMAGLPLRRQGFLRPPRRPHGSSMAGRPAGRSDRLQSRSGPAGLSQTRAAGLAGARRRAPPDHHRRHLFHRHRKGRSRAHLLLHVLTPAPRHPLPGGARGRLRGDRARPPPGRRARNLHDEPCPRRPPRCDAAETAER